MHFSESALGQVWFIPPLSLSNCLALNLPKMNLVFHNKERENGELSKNSELDFKTPSLESAHALWTGDCDRGYPTYR